jgi:hypothetical protein
MAYLRRQRKISAYGLGGLSARRAGLYRRAQNKVKANAIKQSPYY